MERKTYMVGQKNPSVCTSTSFVNAFSLCACYYMPKTVVPVRDCESNETRWFSNRIDRNGNHRCYCEHNGPNGKIIAFH